MTHLQLLVQLQDKDQTITTLQTENDNIRSSLHAAETRLAELYADQGRMEEEMAARMEVTEKLRNQVRELEKEKRDLQKRYNEQVSYFSPFYPLFFQTISRPLLSTPNDKPSMTTNNTSSPAFNHSHKLESNPCYLHPLPSTLPPSQTLKLTIGRPWNLSLHNRTSLTRNKNPQR